MLSQRVSQTNAGQFFQSGTVLNQVKTKWRILTDQGEFIEAALAPSCLVAPQKMSDVCLVLNHNEYYIVAVLTHPSKTLNLAAKHILLESESLELQNKTTAIKTNQLRFEARRIFTLAKRAYSQLGHLWQKSDSTLIDSQVHQIKAKTILAEASDLHSVTANLISEKAEVLSTQADKVLIN